MLDATLFYLLGGLALVASGVVIGQRNPIYSAFALVVTLCSLAGIYGLLGSPFIAALQVIVYAGAIMVLFLFIIMMLGLAPQEVPEGPGWQRWGPLVLLSSSMMICTLLLIFQDPLASKEIGDFYLAPQALGEALFGRYALAVEIVSFQLLFATIGAYILGRPLPKGDKQ